MFGFKFNFKRSPEEQQRWERLVYIRSYQTARFLTARFLRITRLDWGLALLQQHSEQHPRGYVAIIGFTMLTVFVLGFILPLGEEPKEAPEKRAAVEDSIFSMAAKQAEGWRNAFGSSRSKRNRPDSVTKKTGEGQVGTDKPDSTSLSGEKRDRLDQKDGGATALPDTLNTNKSM